MKAKKRTVLKSALLAGAAILSALLFDVASLGGLKDVSRPYLGTYECERILFGNEDRTDKFDYVRIELMPGGKMKLFYKEKEGRKGEAEARYTYDTESDSLTICADIAGTEYKKSFPVKDGALELSVRYGDRMLAMKFVRK